MTEPQPKRSVDHYEAQKAVYWWAPRELVDAGVRAVLAKTFGDYADRRVTLALLTPHARPPSVETVTEAATGVATATALVAAPAPPPAPTFEIFYERSPEAPAQLRGDGATVFETASAPPPGDYWFDYVADLGDGFDGTYSVAELLAQDTLVVNDNTLERGQVLIMGGDEVYPTPSDQAYRNRTVGPYATASQFMDAGPSLYAIPGNHDWYDGLTSFITQFCTEKTIGAWQTKQYRSYTAIGLDKGWWLWAIDAAFEARIDRPQLDFFRKARKALKPGDNLIICTAKPTWLDCPPARGAVDDGAYHLLRDFITETIEGSGASVRLVVAGDKHAYVRYEETVNGSALPNGGQKIVAGGGGAYLVGTTGFSETLKIRETRGGTETDYTRTKVFPSGGESRKLYPTALWRLPQAWGLAAALGVLYLLFGYVFRLAANQRLDIGWSDGITAAGRGDILESAKNVALGSLTFPPMWLLLVLFVFGAAGLANKGRKDGKAVGYLFGIPHTAFHMLAAAVTTVAAVWLAARVDAYWQQAALFSVLAFLIGAVLATLVFTTYLIVASLLGRNQNELFIGIRSRAYKNFLRFRIDGTGDLHVNAIGLRRVNRRKLSWKNGRPEVSGEAATPELIDSFTLKRAPGG